jgi:uncharacterized protein (DUF433 family)
VSTERFEYVRDEIAKAKAYIDETKALIDEYSAPASGMPHTPAQGADSPLERPERDGYCNDCDVPTTTIGGQPWHTGHPKHNEYWIECRGGWPPPKDVKTYTEALVSEVLPADLVTVDPDVQGGEPCMKGTRVQAYLVATLLEDGATWEQVKDIYPSIPTPEVPREAAQPPASGPETSGTGSGRGTGGTEAQNSAQAVEEWGVQLNGGSVVPIQGPDARETAEEFRVAFVEQSRHMGRAASAVTVHRVIGPWMPLDDERGRADER